MSTLRHIFSRFMAHDGFFLAGGLSFYFLVCFVPFVFLMVSLTGFVLSPAAVTGQIQDTLGQVVPVHQDEITRTLLQIINTRRMSGFLGTTILILFSSQLFAALRLVLNRVLDVRGHPLLHGMLFDGLMILASGALFIANVGTTAFVAWLKVVAVRQVHIPAYWMGWMSVALGFVFATATYLVSYAFIPYRRVNLRAALAGALVAGSLLTMAKSLLRVYVTQVGLYDEIYGPLGVLMAFVMFVYYAAVVLVVGAEVVATVDPSD
jgi:membrane protein